MKTAEGGVAATFYAPSTFVTEIPAGRVAFTETTDSPFADTILITVDAAPANSFRAQGAPAPLVRSPEVRVNGARGLCGAGAFHR